MNSHDISEFCIRAYGTNAWLPWMERKIEAGFLCNSYKRIGNPMSGGAI